MNPEIRRQVMSEWRGYAEPKARPDRCSAAGDAAAQVMKRLGLGERLHEAQVMDAWRDVVGEFLALHSAPASLKAGILYVRVLQPTVHYELDRVWKPKILKIMKQRFGARTIRDIRFRLS